MLYLKLFKAANRLQVKLSLISLFQYKAEALIIVDNTY